MDELTKKRWFIYLGDHHEGPFSTEEIQEKRTQGLVTGESYIWQEGMADWLPLRKAPDFEVPLGEAVPSVSLESAVEEPAPEPIFTPPLDRISSSSIDPIRLRKELENIVLEARPTSFEGKSGEVEIHLRSEESHASGPDAFAPKRRGLLRPLKFLVGVLFLTGLWASYSLGYWNSFLSSPVFRDGMIDLADWFPALSPWVSPLPQLEGLSVEDYEKLQTAARGSREAKEIQAAVALSQKDPRNTFFYVACHLQDGTHFKIQLKGISETLVNALSAELQLDATLQKRLGQTSVIRSSNGSLLPEGEYTLTLLQKGVQPLVTQKVFLGGKKNGEYAARLKAYHAQLNDQATNEIAETKQFAATLENQFKSTRSSFDLLKKGKITPNQRKAWANFHHQWASLDSSLGQIFDQWTPDVIQKNYFYGSLYQWIKETGMEISKIHSLQNQYFNKTPDQKALDIQLGETFSSVSHRLSVLQSKVSHAESLIPPAHGMPRRIGL